jgi:copper(I)-binding protein
MSSAGRKLQVVLPLLALAAACASGQNSTQNHEHATPYVPNTHAGLMLVRALRVVAPPPDAVADGFLTMTLVNVGPNPDRLIAATVNGSGRTLVGSLVVPPHEPVLVGGTQPSGISPALVVVGLPGPLHAGTNAVVTLDFSSGGTVTEVVPVFDQQDIGTTDAFATP